MIRPRNAPESALVLQRTTQVPNEATLRATRATAATAQVLVIADTVALHRALQLDDNTVPVREARSLVLPAGPEMAGSLLSAIVNLPAADGAVSPVRAAAPAEDPRGARQICEMRANGRMRGAPRSRRSGCRGWRIAVRGWRWRRRRSSACRRA